MEEYLCNHLNPMPLEVQSGILSCLDQVLCTDFPLKMTRRRVRLLAAEIASMTVTYSRFSGDFLYGLGGGVPSHYLVHTDIKGYAGLIHIPVVGRLHLVYSLDLPVDSVERSGGYRFAWKRRLKHCSIDYLKRGTIRHTYTRKPLTLVLQTSLLAYALRGCLRVQLIFIQCTHT